MVLRAIDPTEREQASERLRRYRRRLRSQRHVHPWRRRAAWAVLLLALLGFAAAWWNNREAASTVSEVIERWIRNAGDS